MAHGDEAAAAGLAVFAPIQDLREGYENDNIRGDELARHITNGTHPASKITGTITAAQIATNAVTPTKIQKRYRCGFTELQVTGGPMRSLSTGLTGPQVVTLTPYKIIPGESTSGSGFVDAVIETINPATGVVTYELISRDGQLGSTYIGWTAVMI